MKRKAVFLDRDGTINFDPGYLGDPSLVKLYPGVAEGIKRLKNLGFLIIVISNQSGVTRKLISHDDVKSVNNKINHLLNEKGTSIDDFFYCPYHPGFDSEEKTKCRKPSPYMVNEASTKYNIDTKQSFFVGDTASDILCGINAGCETILIMNGKNQSEIFSLKKANKTPNFVAANFLDACSFIEEEI